MSMNQEGTTTVTDKDTSSLIETLKATNEELLKHVARKQDILASLSGEQVHYRLDGLTCPDCRHELKEIGSFCARQESCCTFQPRSRESTTSSTPTSVSTAVMKHRLTRLSRLLPTDKKRTCGAWTFRLITRRLPIGISKSVSTTFPAFTSA